MPVVRRCNLKKVIAMIALLIVSAVLVLSISLLFRNDRFGEDISGASQNPTESSRVNEYPSFDVSVDFTPSDDSSEEILHSSLLKTAVKTPRLKPLLSMFLRKMYRQINLPQKKVRHKKHLLKPFLLNRHHRQARIMLPQIFLL